MPENEMAEGFSRRGVLKVAAWAAPAVAVAVAAPLASASQTFDSPTAYVTGTITATGSSSTTRTAVYSSGMLSYDSAGNPGIDSGTITITLYNNRAQYTVDVAAVESAYAAKGWVLVSGNNASITFTHPPVTNGNSIQMPSVTWNAPVGSPKPLVGITVSSDNDDVTGNGLSLS